MNCASMWATSTSDWAWLDALEPIFASLYSPDPELSVEIPAVARNVSVVAMAGEMSLPRFRLSARERAPSKKLRRRQMRVSVERPSRIPRAAPTARDRS